MQTFMKRAAALLLCLVMLLQFTGCQESDITAGADEVADLATVWYLPSTTKPDQTGDNDLKASGGLVYNAVKNEYENYQLVLTAKEDIAAYYLEPADLTCGSNVLSKDNFTVYMEKFVKVNDVSEYESYTRPDALIPQDAALEYGELEIVSGNNGALWVTLYVPEDTVAGTYTGSFKLTVENVTEEIPVSVTVYDYTLSGADESTRTLFSWRYNRVGAGELDSSNEMMETYYDFFQDYRISLQSMPLESTTKEEIEYTFDTYYDSMTSYTLMGEPGKVSGGSSLVDKTKDMIYYIAELSGEDGKNYFEKAMIYAVDEPYLPDESSQAYTIEMCKKVDAFLEDAVTVIEANADGKFTEFMELEGWKESILDIPNIIPLTADSCEWLLNNVNSDAGKAVLEVLNTVCPTFDVYDSDYADKWQSLISTYTNIENVWWYGCTSPRTPYGNYHIGDDLIRSRTVSWVQAKYNIEGNLYWDAAAYTDEADLYEDQYINVYEWPFRNSTQTWPAGDGFLAYPGAAYGIYGPLPSMRLMSIRDGMEELEMLNDLSTDDINSLVGAVSHDGSQLYADGNSGLDFTATRNTLLSKLNMATKGINFSLTETVVEGDQASVSYTTDEENNVYINGELQVSDGEGNYTYQMDLNESSTLDVKIETADGTEYELSQFIANPTTVLQSFDDASVLDGITVSEGGSAELAQVEGFYTSGSAAHLNVVGKITGNELVDAVYVPSVSIDTSLLNEVENLSEVQILKLDVYNAGEQTKVYFKVYSGSSYASLGEKTLAPGKTTVSLDIANVKFSAMAEADRIVIEFANSDDEVTANEYELYIDNMIAAE